MPVRSCAFKFGLFLPDMRMAQAWAEGPALRGASTMLCPDVCTADCLRSPPVMFVNEFDKVKNSPWYAIMALQGGSGAFEIARLRYEQEGDGRSDRRDHGSHGGCATRERPTVALAVGLQHAEVVRGGGVGKGAGAGAGGEWVLESCIAVRRADTVVGLSHCALADWLRVWEYAE